MILETKRLLLREMEQNDFQDLAELLQDPQVMYAYEHDFTQEDVQEWLDRQRKRYAQYGFGLWAVVLKSTGEMIGQAGLTMQPYQGREVLEVGYLLKKRFWHQGMPGRPQRDVRPMPLSVCKGIKCIRLLRRIIPRLSRWRRVWA